MTSSKLQPMYFCRWLLLILAIPIFAIAEFGNGYHIAQSADSLRPWQVSFKPYPGANPVGTDSSYQSRNYNFKYVWLRKEFWIFSTGYQSVKFSQRSGISDSSKMNFEITAHTIMLANTFGLTSDWQMTYNLVFRQGVGQWSYAGNQSEFKTETFQDHYLDFNYVQNLANIWSLGICRATDSILGLNINQQNFWGAGVSHAWNWRRGWLSQLSLGLNHLETGVSRFLFGVAF